MDQHNLKSDEIQDGEFEKLRLAAVEKFQKASLHQSGKLTSPSSLKEPGPGDSPLQCLIIRDKMKTGIFHLYLSLTPSFTDKGKFLLAARRYKSGTQIEYIISTDANDISHGSKGYVGKLSSNFLGANYTIYDTQPPNDKAKAISSKAGRRVANKKISPEVPSSNFEVGNVSYKRNLLEKMGPRRMACSLTFRFSDETTLDNNDQEDLKLKRAESSFNLGFKNKPPIWNKSIECWCLNFHGRGTISSIKNFQLLANVDKSQPGGKGDEETILLQFGKVGDDTFTMDYRHPLSAFQAFAICLTTFGSKLGCQ